MLESIREEPQPLPHALSLWITTRLKLHIQKLVDESTGSGHHDSVHSVPLARVAVNQDQVSETVVEVELRVACCLDHTILLKFCAE